MPADNERGMADVILAMALIAVTIIIGFIGEVMFKRTDIPSVIWLLLFGLLIGPVLRLVEPGVMQAVSPIFGGIALIIILFDGGIHMDLYKLLREAPLGVMLSVTNFLFTIIITTIVLAILGFDPVLGMLLGAIIGGTSSPMVIPIVSRLRNAGKSTPIILSLESAVTDVLCIVAVIALIQMITGGGSIVESTQVLASAFSVGMVVGLIGGMMWLPVLKRYDKIEFSYVITLAMLFLLYATVETIGGSGAIACLMFGVVLANGKTMMGMLRYGKDAFELSDDTKSLHSLMSFLVRTFFFVYLGLLVSLTDWLFIMIGVILVIGTMAARVGAVHLTLPKGFSLFDKRLMYVMLPRGLAAAVLANLVVTKGVPGTNGFMDIVFTVIIGTVLVTTIGVFVMGHAGKEGAEKEEIETAKKNAADAQRKAQIAKKEAEKKAEEIKKKAKHKADVVAKEADEVVKEVTKSAEREVKKEVARVKKIEAKKNGK